MAYRAYVEWGQYMKEMYDQKKNEVLAGTQNERLDLMTAMLQGAGVSKDSKTQTMSEEEIMGNAFVFLVAGHETTAVSFVLSPAKHSLIGKQNSTHFMLVYLALCVDSQRRLQRDLDQVFQGKPPSKWSYEKDIPKLFNNMAGAVMNEELRLIAPATLIPKRTLPGTQQPLVIEGVTYQVPPNTYLPLITPSAHRNPRQWPIGPPRDPKKPAHPLSNPDNDLEEFKPERWILDTDAKRAAAQKIYDLFSNEQSNGHDAEPALASLGKELETPSDFYKPPRGAFFPFSEGARSCIGKRFAPVELLALLAVVFSKYSVELAVDEFASDAEVDRMDIAQKKEVWGKARDKVERQLNEDMGSIITLRLMKGHIPLRLVKRGHERFDF